ncbi:hypothetical protein OPW33_24645 [Vibrio europaeus]|uniref:hypothetical protein n=1 Tax=Vibrio europaeus TaxID=300876 RepID=UPI00234008A5|nr:hypothetical protein [Vibrio europaeus]MDC5842519.1 hypothetical protein [Vibrio europaeus]
MRTKFRLVVHESTGQKYEDLFVKIMSYADINFKPVKAHGNIGDRGNDGWSSVSGRYYQSYAPDDLPENTENAIKKMKADFIKLKSFWDAICPVKEFVFVVNDKFLGVSPHITSAINEIKAENNLSHVEIFGASDLERTLFSLSTDQIAQIVGESRSDGQQHAASAPRNSLQIVDIFEVFDESSEEFYPTTMEIKLRNIGEDVAFIKEVVFETIGYWKIHTDLNHSMVEVSATYDVKISEKTNSIKTIKVHNEVKPQETDRIQFRLRGNDGADPQGLSLYLLKIKVVYNEDSSESDSPFVILNIRPHTESNGYYFHRYKKGTITRNKHVANELLRLTNEGAVCSDYILNAAESWLGAPEEDEYFAQFDD